MNLLQTRKKVNLLLTNLQVAKKTCEQEKENLEIANQNLIYTKEAQDIAQQIAQTIQQQAHNRIAGVVSKCLEAVFVGEDVYGFKIHFDRKRGRTEARLVLTKNGNEIDDPLDFDSGGVCEVAAFALRLSCLVLSKPRLRKVILFDEPFKSISVDYLDNVRELIDKLSKDFGVQFIIVTHISQLETGKIIRL